MADRGKAMSVEKALESGSLSACKVGELRSYLRSVGQPVSGTKHVLIERVQGAYKLGLGNIDEERERQQETQKERERTKLETPEGETLDHPSYIDKWSEDVSLIPDLCEKDIYNYFVLKLGTKRQLKSKVMYEDGHVHSVEVGKYYNTYVIMSHNCFVL